MAIGAPEEDDKLARRQTGFAASAVLLDVPL